jgi:anti-anti-sigma regulatory factor/ABC-type transporter Mla MlaB component
MEVQRASRSKLSPPAGQAEPKLAIEKFADGPITCLRFSGTIDEAFDGKKLANTVECEALILDLGGVKKISSFGIREWVDFINAACARAKQTILIECSPKVVDQLNMVANFAGGGRVFSFYAPFRCDYCDSEHRVLLDVAKDFEAIKTMKLAERPCPTCREAMYFDDDGTTYFSYLLGQGGFELPAEVVQFLAAKLDYRVGSLDGKLRVDKVIEGRITYLRFTGDLNNTFQKDKLAEGLEGTVIVDLAGVPRVEPAGAASWRAFVQQVSPLVDQIDLIGVAPAVLERICTREDLGAKVAVLDFALPYACETCGTTSAQPIEVVTHSEVLKFATAPDLRCPTCKHALQCTASESLMTILPGLPKPTVTKDLARQIEELRGRKLERRTAGNPPLAKPAETALPRRGIAPVAIGFAALAGLAIAYLAYARAHTAPSGPYKLGPVSGRSAPARPDWVGAGTLGSVTCSGATCVGVSLPLASQEEAEDEASDAAYEGVAYEVAGDGWLASIAPQLVETRAAALAAVARDADSAQARRDVHDGRHAVARLFKRSAPPVAARYWESYDAPAGKLYVAFAKVALSPQDAKRLAGSASVPSHALGATAVDLQPELGWRFPRLDHGAVVTKLRMGPLQELGIAEHYIVLAIDGHDVADAAAFEKLATSEYGALVASGGTFRVLVQADTGEPREFSSTIAAPALPVLPGHVTRPTSTAPAPGAVNVWDRYGGNRGSGRDDPTQ